MYARAVTLGLRGADDGLPDLELVVPEVDSEPARLAKYREVCGFSESDTLPPTYPHILAFSTALRLMTDRSFPFSVLGLVHLRNRITQHRPVRTDEPIALHVRAADMGPHPKGTRFDLVTDMRVEDETVWLEAATYLSRGDDAGSGGDSLDGDDSAEGPEPPGDTDTAGYREHATWEVPAHVSTRYAGVSGDRNPHHLHPLLARLFGFPRLLAHGMWMNARGLAGIQELLPEVFRSDVTFNRPLLLPATVTLEVADREDGMAIALRDEESDTPNMSGVVTRL
jgi:acyl dehydratase